MTWVYFFLKWLLLSALIWGGYFWFDKKFDGHWGVPTGVVISLVIFRVCLFYYRKSKGIHDAYLDDLSRKD